MLHQKHHKDEAHGEKPVDPTGIPADVEARVVQDGCERDIERPDTHRNGQPQVEHGAPAPPEKNGERDQRQPPGGGGDVDLRRAVGVAAHDLRQGVMSGGGEKDDGGDSREQERDGSHNRDRRPGVRSPAPVLPALQDCIADHEDRKAAVPDEVEPRRCLWSRSEQSAREEQPGEAQHVRNRHHG